jgi:hypothetical protein
MLKGKNWDDMADFQMENVFIMTDKNDKDLKKMSDLYTDDLTEGVFDPTSIESND